MPTKRSIETTESKADDETNDDRISSSSRRTTSHAVNYNEDFESDEGDIDEMVNDVDEEINKMEKMAQNSDEWNDDWDDDDDDDKDVLDDNVSEEEEELRRPKKKVKNNQESILAYATTTTMPQGEKTATTNTTKKVEKITKKNPPTQKKGKKKRVIIEDKDSSEVDDDSDDDRNGNESMELVDSGDESPADSLESFDIRDNSHQQSDSTSTKKSESKQKSSNKRMPNPTIAKKKKKKQSGSSDDDYTGAALGGVDYTAGESDDDDSFDRRPRPPPKRKPKARTTKSQKKKSSRSKPAAAADAPRRVSSRKTKFTESMEEPTMSSITYYTDQFLGKADGQATTTLDKTTQQHTTRDENVVKNGDVKQPPQKINTTLDDAPIDTSKSPKSPKSPATTHAMKRKKVHVEIHPKNSASSSDSDDDLTPPQPPTTLPPDGEDELKIQRIIASRSETKKKWKEIGLKKNTSEIENGSRWFQASDDEDNSDDNPDEYQEKYLVKWADMGFLHCSWETEADLMEQVEGAKVHLTNFFKKSKGGYFYGVDERADGDYFDPSWVQIDRILEIVVPEGYRGEEEGGGGENKYGIILDRKAENYGAGTGRQLLIKWCNLPYTESKYEFERDLILNDVEYEEHIEAFKKRTTKPTKNDILRSEKSAEKAMRKAYKIFGENLKESQKVKEANVAKWQGTLANRIFKNGGQLRDYQAEGVSWFVSNHVNGRSSILADEMGLGKTVQTATYINTVATAMHKRGPFLIVAPLSTIPHWYREFTSWTDLNTIIYHGSANDREYIREFEFAFPSDRPTSLKHNQSFLRSCFSRKTPKWQKTWMVDVVITTPEMLVTEDFMELCLLDWEVLVVDEAHRLKNHASKLAGNLRDERFVFGRILLLTGTPIQNNMNELWTLLNFVDEGAFGTLDKFLSQYGDMKSKDSVDALHETIRPYILRRLKEDVEKSVPPKEETLIEVELTIVQKKYYRALYEKNHSFLLKNKKKAIDGPSLNNLAIQLRKCCNHPFLLNGVEHEIRQQEMANGNYVNEADFLVKASGKLVLLDKLLPHLRQGGHRVLIFSQFKIMLDVLEDYLRLRQMTPERIDGSITGRKRQMSIDRFQDPNGNSFVMLLSTRAGGVGINLTAADTCIIFDSDWNPQNDLQAQARCHRIGQTKDVKVYRLLTRKTYEMQMFHMSSLKMGLEAAVLQGFGANNGNGENALTREEVERLLKHGAYDIFNEEKNGTSDAASDEFISQDITSILARRSKTIVHENTGSQSNAAGSTFSKASFKAAAPAGASKQEDDVDVDDPDFWKKMLGEARVKRDDRLVDPGKKRNRRHANYKEDDFDGGDHDLGHSSDYSDENESTGSEGKEGKGKMRKSSERMSWGAGGSTSDWRRKDVENLIVSLMTQGYGNIPWERFFRRDGPDGINEVIRMSWAIVFATILEQAEAEAQVATIRSRKATQKKIDEGGILANTATSPAHHNNPDGQEFKAEDSFNAIWKRHLDWLKVVVRDANEYASKNKSRSSDVIDSLTAKSKRLKEGGPSALEKSFKTNLWPALNVRGWTCQQGADISDSEKFQFGGLTFLSVQAVLEVIPSYHPELADVVKSISGAIPTDSSDPSSQVTRKSTSTPLDSQNMTYSVMSDFLSSYGPFQLVADRARHKKITLYPKLLKVCSFMKTSHSLVRTANCHSDPDAKLAELVSGPGMSYPRKWNADNDATLVRAIVKYGWFDRDSNYHAVANDETFKWGSAPSDGQQSQKQCGNNDLAHEVNSEALVADLKATAERAKSFLESNMELVDELKGFNTERVLNSYGIEIVTSINHHLSQLAPRHELIIHLDQLQNNFRTALKEGKPQNAPDERIHRVYAPTRKYLLKRARELFAFLNDPGDTPDTATNPTTPNEDSPHNYTVLDQTVRCHVLLTEMLHGLTKISLATDNPWGKWKRLLHNCRQEAQALADNSTSNKEDMENIVNHLNIADTVPRLQLRLAKNVLRAILGLPPSVHKNPNDAIFPEPPKQPTLPIVVVTHEKQARPYEPRSSEQQQPKPSKRSSSSSRSQQRDTSTGEAALARAVPAFKLMTSRNNSSPSPAKGFDNGDNGVLQLSSLEMVILSVICSQGLPVWSENSPSLMNKIPSNDVLHSSQGKEFELSWTEMGSVVETAAKIGYNSEQKKLEISEQQLMTVSNVSSLSSSTAFQVLKNNCEALEKDVKIKKKALSDAVMLVLSPELLAQKVVMLLQALRQRMGNLDMNRGGSLKKIRSVKKSEHGLGPRVLHWFGKELGRWAETLDIMDKNTRQPLSTTDGITRDDRGKHPELSACLDKKGCRAVFGQVAQQTRLRSVFIKNGKENMRNLVPKAVKNSKNNGDVWNDCPPWWSSTNGVPAATTHTAYDDDIELLIGVIMYGFSAFEHFLRESQVFKQRMEASGSIHLTKASIQPRVNHLTRELSALEETSEMIKMVTERQSRNNSACLKSPSPHKNGQNASSGSRTLLSGGGIQTGIDAFFSVPQSCPENNNDNKDKPSEVKSDVCDMAQS